MPRLPRWDRPHVRRRAGGAAPGRAHGGGHATTRSEPGAVSPIRTVAWRLAGGPAPSVAEHGGIVGADPLPERCRARKPRVGDERTIVELAGVEADRADEQLAAALGVLLEELRKRWATLAGDPLRVSPEPDSDGFLGEE